MLKKIKPKQLLCIALTLSLAICAFMLPSTAASEPLIHKSTVVSAVNAFDNDTTTMEYEYDFGYTPTVSTYQNPNGSYAICIKQNDGSLKIAEVTASGTLISHFTVAKELDSYVAFTKGNEGSYYLLFNQKLTADRKGETALRLVNYSANGERLRECNISGNPSGSFLGIAEVFAGNNALSANNNIITGYVARDMFPAEDGGVHQSSYAFAIDLNTFKKIEIDHSVKSPYVSHSFHQFILKDGDDFVYVDRGDADPFRSFRVSKMCSSSWVKDPDTYAGLTGLVEKEYKRGNSFKFKGAYADNNTYSQLGGIVKTNSGYMLAGTYQNTISETSPSSANVFVQLFNTNKLDAKKEIYLTNYSDSAATLKGITSTANNPKIISIDSNYVAVPYMLSNAAENKDEMHIIFVDGSGNFIENKAVEFASGVTYLPRYGNVYYSSKNNSIDWFGIVKGELVMNSVSLGKNEESSTNEATTAPTEEETTTQPENTTAPETTQPGTTQPTTQAPTEPTQPQEPNFFQRILDFFIMVYNWFISLFS